MADSTEIHNADVAESDGAIRKRVIHVVVGHGLRTYFVNAIRSVRSVAPDDEILVVDNDSPDQELRDELTRISDDDPKMKLLLRHSNSLINGKVGGLYDAYRDAFEIAIREKFDYVHIVQGDLQVLWWDDDVVSRAAEIFAANPTCVNIFMCMLSTDWSHLDSFVGSDVDDLKRMRGTGLLDLGLYDLERWKSLGVFFDNDELDHRTRYFSEGFSVICHPWPTDAPIPWPAVVRKGVQQGKEVRLVKPYLLKPISATGVEKLKARNWTWLEDGCTPWGWTCLTPMWTTETNSDYLANRRAEAKRSGLLKGAPRWERSGLDNKSLRSLFLAQHRPSLWKLFVVVPSRELLTRFKQRMRRSE